MPELEVAEEQVLQETLAEVMEVQEVVEQLIQQQDHLSLMVAEVAEESVTQVLEEQVDQAEAEMVLQLQELQDHQVQLTPEAVEVDQDIVQHLTLWDME
jgi:anti-sigma factor RsiW